MVGNAHIDPVWLWTAAEGRQETLDTCLSALERMEETDSFVFCCSTAAGYRWIQETAPEVFERIRRRAAEGRWVVVGGWWVEPDCNIPSGESLVRQGLVGLSYVRDELEVDCRVGYNVDTFGHPWTLTQLLHGLGQKYYVFFRPGPHEKALPSGLFWWEGPDGTRTLTSRPVGHYNTGPDDIERRVREAAGVVAAENRDEMAFYGVGNHGGGPTRANIASILRLVGAPDLPEVRFSHPEAFFEAVQAEEGNWPVVRDELQHHARGCYTAVAAIKALNRRAEGALQDAEQWSCLAEVLAGAAPPRARLRECWETVLFNQFHDILAGTSIRAACEDTLRENQLTIDECHSMALAATRLVAARVEAPGPAQTLVAFNPLGWERGGVTEAEVNWREGARGLTVTTHDGAPVETQILDSNWSGGGRSANLLVNTSIPACGYRALRIGPAEGEACSKDRPTEAWEMDNGLLHVKLGSGDAWIEEIRDPATGLVPTSVGCGGIVVLGDPSDTWSHDVVSFRDEIGRFEMVGAPEVLEWGPLRWTLRARGAWGSSCLIQEISLSKGRRMVEVRAEIDWQERHRMAKLRVPTRVEGSEATSEIAYGAVARAQTGEEEPGQRWVDVSGDLEGVAYGVSLLNDCKYGFDVLGGEMRMSVVRSPIYAFHDPAQVQPGESYEYTDQGVHVFRYAIVPHTGDWREGGIPRLAAEFNRPCLVLHEPGHGTGSPGEGFGVHGTLPAEYSLAATDQANVDVETIKPTENGEGMAIRLRETFGRPTRCTVMLGGRAGVALEFGAREIKTLVAAPAAAGWQVYETDLLERPR